MTHYARLRAHRRVLISDIDGTLHDGVGAGRGCGALGERLREARAALVLATGRSLQLTVEVIEELTAAGLPRPEALICAVGSEIYLGDENRADDRWAEHLLQGWDGELVRATLDRVSGLRSQGPEGQGRFKASYFFEPAGAAPAAEALEVTKMARAALTRAGLETRLIPSAGRYLDVLPVRASKGAAAAWLLARAAIHPSGAIVAGDSGNDREMLTVEIDGRPLKAVVVGNHDPELDDLVTREGVYLATRFDAAGVVEGIVAHGW